MNSLMEKDKSSYSGKQKRARPEKDYEWFTDLDILGIKGRMTET
jgi:hypothetical protein